ncbi:MAG: DUF1674 domain-containing protein [Xanthomonadales bacterium]|jgi:hypothetical protein|nr:DUF1674 domain-containing protein [Xanthomonadales bacterium]
MNSDCTAPGTAQDKGQLPGRNSDPETRDSTASSEESATAADTAPEGAEKEREIGGRKGPDPTRYGDWEKGGRCIDF